MAKINLRLFRKKDLKGKESIASKERRAIREQATDSRSLRDKAYNDYLAGKIDKQQLNSRIRKAEKIRRGF